MPKVIMLLSNPFRPEFRPDIRVHKEAKTLAERGYEVEIIAWDREMKYPESEVIDGIKVTRYRRKAKPHDFFSVALNIIFFHLHVFMKLIRTAPDIVHCHDLDTLAPGVFAGKLKNKKVVYDAHELYPEVVAADTPSAIVNLLKRIEKYLTKRADAVIYVSKAQADFCRKYNARNVAIVMSCFGVIPVNAEKLLDARQRLSGAKKKTIVLYIGMLEPQRMVEEMTELISSLEDDYILVIGGFGSLESKIRAKESKNIHFLGRVHPDDTAIYTRAADVFVEIIDPKNINYRVAAPNKLFEAMAAGKPIIVSRETHAGEIVDEENCGMLVNYGNKEETLEALEKLRNDKKLYNSLRSNGLKAAESKYNWGIMGERLLKIYEGLASS